MLIRTSFLALAAAGPASTTATKTPNALALAEGVDGDSAGPPGMAVARGWRGRPILHAARGSAPSPHKKADLGALEPVQRLLQTCPTVCPENQVGYCSGSPIIEDIVCGGECCTGDRACEGFTGCVKKDGSCEGDSACYKAVAPGGIEDSCKGVSACKAMSNGSSVKSSCNGLEACSDVATLTGVAGAINKSCNGDKSCWGIGSLGNVGALDKSCNGISACAYLGSLFGRVGPVTKSCNRDNSCENLGKAQFSIESITFTCNNDKHKPCRILEGVSVGHLTKFIHTDVGKKHKKEDIGDIGKCHDECANDSECNGIKWKDHSGMPCRFFGGEISENRCNGRNVCITV